MHARPRSLARAQVCLDYILTNLDAVKQTQGFVDLREEPDLLMEIILRQTK